MGEVVPFRRPLSLEQAPQAGGLKPHAITSCEGLLHVFATVPGRCQCGSELWVELGQPAEGVVGVCVQVEPSA